MKRKNRFMVIMICIAVVVLGAGAWFFLRPKHASDVLLRTVPLKRGNLLATISATGVVEPEEVVDVGAQVAGQINSFGKDANGKSVDYGSVVTEDTILAQIDDSLYASAVETATAQFQQAKANQLSADANLLQIKAKLAQAQADWDRAQKLGPSEALAPSAYDQYKTNFEVAKANVGVAEAAVEQAKAATAQAKANLDYAQRNLGYCTIKSPVKGVIIDRRVNIGQTVVSSLSAPSLFLIAKDLTRIQVWISVNEADIGSIHPGQTVTFTVDAFPGRIFRGEVGKVRLNASMTQNVVTYTVEVNTDNADGKLLPYLTANAQFEIGRRQNVLLVPNAALRWSPRPNQIAGEFRQPAGASTKNTRVANTANNTNDPHVVIWVQQGALARPVRVTTGMTDGNSTEVQGADLTEGMQVIIGERSPSDVTGGSSGAVSPFVPQIGAGRSQQRPQGQGGGGR